MDISVIIPTHNRAASVVRAVRSAMAVDYPANRYEIIVVDNASMDATPQVVQNLQSDSNRCNLRYLREDQLGLHNARHEGARAAKGDVLIFTDDDATFDPDWPQAYAKAFAEHPEMAAAGGPVRPIWEASPPEWLLEFMGSAKMFTILALMEPHQEFRLDPKGFFFGVNMAIQRNVLFEVGGFNPEAFGDIWLGDGEAGLNRKLWERGMLVGYVTDAVVYHHIPASRMTLAYFQKRMSNEGACDAYAKYHPGIPSLYELARDILRIALHNAPSWLGAVALWGQTSRKALNVQLRAARSWSHMCYILRLMRDPVLRCLVTKSDWLNAI